MLPFEDTDTKHPTPPAATLGEETTFKTEKAAAEAMARDNPNRLLPTLLVNLLEKHRYRKLLEETWKDKERLSRALEQTQWHPAVFLETMNSFPERGLVAVDNQRLSVACAPEVDISEFTCGAPVFLDAAMNLLVGEAPETIRVGTIGSFSRFHGEQAVIRGPADEEIVVTLAEELAGEDFSSGDLLLYSRETMVAWDKVETEQEKSGLLQEVPADIAIENLGALDDVYEGMISEIKLHLFHQDLVRQHRLSPVQGMLLSGPPGVGKTSLIRCLGHHISSLGAVEAKVLLAPPGIHRSMWFGKSEENVRNLFREAKKVVEDKGCYALLVFDDVDQLGARDGMHAIDSRILPSFLQEIDELHSVERLILVGATNRPDLLDEALLRPGRFGDREYRISRPRTRQAVREILSCYLTEDVPYQGNGKNGNGLPEAIMEDLLSALFAPNGDLASPATLHFRDGSTEPVTPAMVMSGALIRGAAEEAKRRSCLRGAKGEPLGVSSADLLAGFDRELSAVVGRLTPATAGRLLDLPLDMDVIKIEKRRASAPRKHDYLGPMNVDSA